MTTHPDLTAARDALAVALHAEGFRCVPSAPKDMDWHRDWAFTLLAALPDGWTLARAEAGVSVEALRQAFLDIEYPEVFADGESRRLSAALAARSAGSGSRVERVRREQAAGGGPVTAVIVSRTTEYATGGNPRPTPPPAVDDWYHGDLEAPR